MDEIRAAEFQAQRKAQIKELARSHAAAEAQKQWSSAGGKAYDHSETGLESVQDQAAIQYGIEYGLCSVENVTAVIREGMKAEIMNFNNKYEDVTDSEGEEVEEKNQKKTLPKLRPFEKELQAFRQEFEAFKTENILKFQVLESKIDSQGLQKQLEDLQKEFAQVYMEKKALEESESQMTSNLEFHHLEFQKTLAKKESEHQELLQKTLEAQYQDFSENEKKLQLKNEAYEKKLEMKDAEILELQKTIQKTLIVDVDAEIQKAQKASDDEIQMWETSYAKLQETSNYKIGILESRILELQKAMSTSEVEKLEIENIHLLSTIQEMSDSECKAKMTVDSLLQNLQKTSAAEAEAMQNLEFENQTLNRKIQELEVQILNLQEGLPMTSETEAKKIKELEDVKGKLYKRHDSLLLELQEARNQISRLQNFQKTSELKMKEMESDILRSDKAYDTVQDELTIAWETNFSIHKKQKASEEKILELKNHQKTLEDKIDELQKALEAKDSELTSGIQKTDDDKALKTSEDSENTMNSSGEGSSKCSSWDNLEEAE